MKEGGIKILKGNIAPDGAILKPSAASPELMKHKGKAVVFESVEEFHDKIDDPNLDVDENSILVLDTPKSVDVENYVLQIQNHLLNVHLLLLM